jgi:hypothetical protein
MGRSWHGYQEECLEDPDGLVPILSVICFLVACKSGLMLGATKVLNRSAVRRDFHKPVQIA